MTCLCAWNGLRRRGVGMLSPLPGFTEAPRGQRHCLVQLLHSQPAQVQCGKCLARGHPSVYSQAPLKKRSLNFTHLSVFSRLPASRETLFSVPTPISPPLTSPLRLTHWQARCATFIVTDNWLPFTSQYGLLIFHSWDVPTICLFFTSVFVLIWQTHTHLNCCLLRRLLTFSQVPKTVVSLKGPHTPTFIPVLTLFFLKKTPQIPAWLQLACHLFYLWGSRLYTLSRPHSEKPLGLKELLLDLIFQNFSAVFIAYWVSFVLFCVIPFS